MHVSPKLILLGSLAGLALAEDHLQDDCAKACSNALFACKSKPDANQSSCVSTFNTCVGFEAIGNGKADYYPATCKKDGASSSTAQASATPTAHPQDDCAKACSNALFDCKSKPDANQAYCVGTFNTCVGYMAIGNGQADYYPEHCKKGSASATSTATATPTAHPQDECAKACSTALFECKSKPDANQAYCVSTFNNCVGYMAIGDGKADYYPEHCQKGSTTMTTMTATPSTTAVGHQQDACAKACSDQLFACKGKPDANQSFCVSQFDTCVGYQAIGNGKADYYPSACKKAQPSASMTVTSSVPGSSTPVTAGVGAVKPGLALAALGLAAVF